MERSPSLRSRGRGLRLRAILDLARRLLWLAKHGPVRCRSNVPGPPPRTMLTITLCLFLAGMTMGAVFACVWAWGVRSGQFRDLEDSRQQVTLRTFLPGAPC